MEDHLFNSVYGIENTLFFQRLIKFICIKPLINFVQLFIDNGKYVLKSGCSKNGFGSSDANDKVLKNRKDRQHITKKQQF